MAETVVFDFSRVGRTWNRDFLKSMSKASRAQLVLNRTLPDDATDEEADELFAKQEKALDDLDNLSDEQAGMLAQVLVSVPDDWLIEGAPQDLNWSDVASLDYIQADKYAELFGKLRTRNVAQGDSKNSDGHTPSAPKRRGR